MGFNYFNHWFPMVNEENTDIASLVTALNGTSYAPIDVQNAVKMEWRAKALNWQLDIVNPDPAYTISEGGSIDTRPGLVSCGNLVAQVAATGDNNLTYFHDELISVGGSIVLTSEIDPGEPGYTVGNNVRVRLLFWIGGAWAQIHPSTPQTTGTYSFSVVNQNYAINRDDALVLGSGSNKYIVPAGAHAMVLVDTTTEGGPPASNVSILDVGTNPFGTVDASTRMAFGDGVESNYGFFIPFSEPATGFQCTLSIGAVTNLVRS